MNDKEILNLIKLVREQEKQKSVIPMDVPSPFKPLRFNFHHGQKVKIKGGYYNTYKGYIKDKRVLNDNRIEYLVELVTRDDNIEVWIIDDFIKKSWF